MSSLEKNEIILKEDWIKLLDENDLGRSNMNKLIMNYLVTGSQQLFLEFIERFLLQKCVHI